MCPLILLKRYVKGKCHSLCLCGFCPLALGLLERSQESCIFNFHKVSSKVADCHYVSKMHQSNTVADIPQEFLLLWASEGGKLFLTDFAFSFAEPHGGEQSPFQDHHNLPMVPAVVCHSLPQQDRHLGREDRLLTSSDLLPRIHWWDSFVLLQSYACWG